MTRNPFQPPETAPRPQAANEAVMMPVFVGVAIGVGLWYLVGSLSGLAFTWWLTLAGVPMAQLFQRAYTYAPYLVFAHALAFPCMAVGGFWAARMANDRGRSAALFSGFLVTLVTLLQFATPYSLPLPWWSRLLSVLLPIPGYLVGAGIRRRRESLVTG